MLEILVTLNIYLQSAPSLIVNGSTVVKLIQLSNKLTTVQADTSMFLTSVKLVQLLIFTVAAFFILNSRTFCREVPEFNCKDVTFTTSIVYSLSAGAAGIAKLLVEAVADAEYKTVLSLSVILILVPFKFNGKTVVPGARVITTLDFSTPPPLASNDLLLIYYS